MFSLQLKKYLDIDINHYLQKIIIVIFATKFYEYE